MGSLRGTCAWRLTALAASRATSDQYHVGHAARRFETQCEKSDSSVIAICMHTRGRNSYPLGFSRRDQDLIFRGPAEPSEHGGSRKVREAHRGDLLADAQDLVESFMIEPQTEDSTKGLSVCPAPGLSEEHERTDPILCALTLCVRLEFGSEQHNRESFVDTESRVEDKG
eukprot:2825443-Rhodomonas_salina.2